MNRAAMLICPFVFCGGLINGRGAAQSSCTEPTTSEWLKQPPRSSEPTTVVDTSQVHPVTQELPRAVKMLENHSIVPLEPMDVIQVGGGDVATLRQEQGRQLRPYLVRAVFPTPSPKLDVRWSGSSLQVFAGGLGCAPFAKHPIIVFLHHQPTQVFVMASAAL